jgi:hypothetical protein
MEQVNRNLRHFYRKCVEGDEEINRDTFVREGEVWVTVSQAL